MKYYFFLTQLVLVFFISSCKKDKPAEIEEVVTCSNSTLTINDSLIALFTSTNSASTNVLKIQNGVTTTLTNQAGFDFWGPSISPDKSKFICFRSTIINSIDMNDYANAELWLFNIDGSNGHQITSVTSQALAGMGMAKWAPDGFHIVFSGEKNEIDGNLHWNVYLTDTLGTLATKMNTRLGSFTYPAFANGDITKLIYEAWNVGVTVAGNENNSEIHLATVDGSFQITAEQQLTNNGFYESSPSFSPDNANIVYSQNTSANPNTAIQLYTYNIGTSTASLLLSNNNFNEYPFWCVTNNKIYFSNKASINCFAHGARVETNGTNFERPYRQTNTNYFQIDIK